MADGLYLIPELRMALRTTPMILSVNTFKAPFDCLTPSPSAMSRHLCFLLSGDLKRVEDPAISSISTQAQ
jgi:hypothetical protein